jgi:hypothetical protein
MKFTADEARKDYGLGTPESKDLPAYPYGLTLCLNDDSLKKLGISIPQVGTKFTLTAMVEVVSVHAQKEVDGDTNVGADLQITDMELTEGKTVDPKSLYPNSNY